MRPPHPDLSSMDIQERIRAVIAAEAKAIQSLKTIFGVKQLRPPIKEVFTAALEKDYRVYFFDRTDEEVEVRDISSLDPGDDDDRVSGWGGLSGFSGRIADIVGDALYAGSVT